MNRRQIEVGKMKANAKIFGLEARQIVTSFLSKEGSQLVDGCWSSRDNTKKEVGGGPESGRRIDTD